MERGSLGRNSPVAALAAGAAHHGAGCRATATGSERHQLEISKENGQPYFLKNRPQEELVGRSLQCLRWAGPAVEERAGHPSWQSGTGLQHHQSWYLTIRNGQGVQAISEKESEVRSTLLKAVGCR